MLRATGFMNNRKITSLFVFMTIAYAGLSLFGPIDPIVLARYHITEAQTRLLTLTVVLPYVAIWLTALHGIIRFRNYTKVIESTKEGTAFKRLSLGVTLLGFSLPASGLFNSLLTVVIIKHPDLTIMATILRNYITLILPAAGLLVINNAASQLIATLRRSVTKTWMPFTLPGIIILSSVYTWLITTRPYSSGADTSYFLPNWIVLATLAIPYLYVWCRGILGAYKLLVYKQNTRGIVYKKSLNLVARGVGTIIILSVLTQLLTTITARLNRLNLTPILLIVYILVALNALGFGMVALGANKLKKIEEV